MQTGRVNEEFLNFRMGAGTEHEVIRILAPNLPFLVHGEHGDWLEIEVDGERGFVHAGYVTLDEEAQVSPQAGLPTQSIGMTLSHYEFDLDLLDDAGNANHIEVENAGTMADILQKFNVLRFMNWQKTNVNPIWQEGTIPEFHHPPQTVTELQKWDTRDNWRKPAEAKSIFDARWGENPAVPLSICLNVAKKTNSHPWLCIPHGNSAADFQEIMQYIVDTTFDALAGTGLTPIFEYSNEVWNEGRFRQQIEIANLETGRDVKTFRHKLPPHIQDKINKGQPLSDWEQGEKHKVDKGKGDSRLAAFKRQIQCTNEIKAYVGDRGWVVIGAQCNDADVAKRLLFHDVALSSAVDALAIAPYFGPVRHVQAGWGSLSEIFPNGFHPLIKLKNGQQINPWAETAIQELYENLRDYVLGVGDIGGEIRRAFEKHRTLVDRYNEQAGRSENPLRLVTYEGGLDLNNHPSQFRQDGASLLKMPANFSDKNFQKQTGNLYHQFHHAWQSGQLMSDVLSAWQSPPVNGDLFVGYSSATRYLKEDDENPQQKKAGDFFGYIDLQDVPGKNNNDKYVGTPKLNALLAKVR